MLPNRPEPHNLLPTNIIAAASLAVGIILHIHLMFKVHVKKTIHHYLLFGPQHTQLVILM